MDEDSSYDSGDPEYYNWGEGIYMEDPDTIENEMLDIAFDDCGASESLRDFVEGLRADKRRLRYECRLLRVRERESDATVESLRGELTEQKEMTKMIKRENCVKAFVWGLLIGMAVVCYVMY